MIYPGGPKGSGAHHADFSLVFLTKMSGGTSGLKWAGIIGALKNRQDPYSRHAVWGKIGAHGTLRLSPTVTEAICADEPVSNLP